MALVARLIVAAMIGFAHVALTVPLAAQKSGGTLRVSNSANPVSMSIHEEAAVATVQSVMRQAWAG